MAHVCSIERRRPSTAVRRRTVDVVTRPHDTTADADDRQIAAIRAMTPEHRLQIAATMTDEVRMLATAGIRARKPGASAEEIEAALAEILLGHATAEVLRQRRA